MCGIAGAFHYNAPHHNMNKTQISAMNSVQRHRGPDDEGCFIENNVGLGHARLSILDVSAVGHQPMLDPSGRYVISYNGEVYNFQELKKELQELGHSFGGTSDTEVVLAAFHQWKEDAFARFNGIFALALYDRQEKRLTLARDPIGVKPLFYFDTGKSVYFASEVKGILVNREIPREIDTTCLDSYFTFNYCPAPFTGIRGLRQVLPGRYHQFAFEEKKEVRFWKLNFTPEEKAAGNFSTELEKFKTHFQRAVKSQTVSDVPVGAFLSGGYDSSAVVKALVETGSSDIRLFNVRFENSAYDESPTAARIASSLGVELEHIDCPTQFSKEDMIQLSKHLEEPLADASAIPFFQLCKAASSRVKVALSGDGGDELLAGYETYRATLLSQHLKSPLLSPFMGIFRRLLQTLPASDARYSWKDVLTRISLYAQEPFPREHCSWRTIFSSEQKKELYKPDFLSQVRDHDPIQLYADTLKDLPDSVDVLNQLLYLDMAFYMPSDLIAKVDRMGMAHSLEVRVPFLDPKFVEYCATIPPRWKLYDGKVRKYILRKYLEDRIPEEVLQKPKSGFNAPVAGFMRGEGAELLAELTSSYERQMGQYLNIAGLRNLLQKHRSEREDHRYSLYSALVFGLWIHNLETEWKVG